MALLGLPLGALHGLAAQSPGVLPLLLKARLTPADILALRREVAALADGPADTQPAGGMSSTPAVRWLARKA